MAMKDCGSGCSDLIRIRPVGKPESGSTAPLFFFHDEIQSAMNIQQQLKPIHVALNSVLKIKIKQFIYINKYLIYV